MLILLKISLGTRIIQSRKFTAVKFIVKSPEK